MRAKARELLLEANKGTAGAQRLIGDMYYYGNAEMGVEEDRLLGVQWLARAASQGDKQAIEELHILAGISKLAALEETRPTDMREMHEKIAFYEQDAELYADIFGVTLTPSLDAEGFVAHEEYVPATHFEP